MKRNDWWFPVGITIPPKSRIQANVVQAASTLKCPSCHEDLGYGFGGMGQSTAITVGTLTCPNYHREPDDPRRCFTRLEVSL